MRSPARWLVLLLLPVLLAATTRPATQPDPVSRRARDEVAAGHLANVAAMVEPRLREILAHPATIDPDALIRLSAWRQMARYFARISELDPGLNDTLHWLATEPEVREALMMAVSSADPPDRVLQVLRAMRADNLASVEKFSALSAAMCVVWDAPEHFGTEEDAKTDPAEVSRVFAYFARLANKNPEAFHRPVELLAYVVDINLNDDELHWAAARYGAGIDLPRIFFAVPFAQDSGYDHTKQIIDQDSYVLPNILHHGGQCADEAYYAVQIARAGGVPAAVFNPSNISDGLSAAWVGFVIGKTSHVAWDFNDARYPEHAGWWGVTIDPQNGSTIDQNEVALSAAVSQTSARNRLASAALCQNADLAGDGDGDAIPIYLRAIELSPCNRTPWLALSELGMHGKVVADDSKIIVQYAQKYLMKTHPGFALSVRLRMIDTGGTIAYSAASKKLAQEFADYPELAARVKLALADRLNEDHQVEPAIQVLTDVLRDYSGLTPVLLAAVSRLDAILHKTDNLPLLASIYHDLFSRLPRPQPKKWGRTTAYYHIGDRYAFVLDEQKQPQAAELVREAIYNTVLP